MDWQQKKKTAKYIAEHYDTKSFIASFDVSPGREPGFRYIFDLHGIKSHHEGIAASPLIEVQIPPKDDAIKVTDDIGLKVHPDVKLRK